MSFSARSRVAHALAVGAVTVAALAFAPATANAGFFDQLFGGGAPQPAQPSYNYEAPQDPGTPQLGDPVNPRRAKKKVAVHEAAPVRQKTTSLMDDRTLRPGDAIMMKDGLHIYNGPEAPKHSAKQFVPIDDARHVSSSQRAALAEIDTTRNDPLQSGRAPDTLASGRSASVGTPISQGFRITDARGASIRYVGP